MLAAAGVDSAVTTDDGGLAGRAESAGFATVRCLETTAVESAATIADTQLGQFFAEAIGQLELWSRAGDVAWPSRLLWLHTRGFHGSWDAPLELRQSLLDEEDPPAPTFLAPPTAVAVHDHDEMLLYRAAYAAQVMVLDECAAALLAALTELGLDQDTLVILAGARGYALGEHGAVGGEVDGLYSELLHVPCLVRRPAAPHPPPRSPQLALPIDLAATLVDWFDLPSSGAAPHAASLLSSELALPAPSRRQYVVARGKHEERAVRTAAWMLRQAPLAPSGGDDAPPAVELYAKPDDRWEANEVASRAPEIAARLLAVVRNRRLRTAKPCLRSQSRWTTTSLRRRVNDIVAGILAQVAGPLRLAPKCSGEPASPFLQSPPILTPPSRPQGRGGRLLAFLRGSRMVSRWSDMDVRC
jgi:arylsulfatase A-like enzyme